MRSFSKKFVLIIVVMVVVLSSCMSVQEKIDLELNRLPITDSDLIYKYGSGFTSDAGECGGAIQERWYGTSVGEIELASIFNVYLVTNGWEIWPGEVADIWSKEGDDGLYRFSFRASSDIADFSQQRASYLIPKSEYEKMDNYDVVYNVSLIFMTFYAANNCFGYEKTN
jgi:hypothetical protein